MLNFIGLFLSAWPDYFFAKKAALIHRFAAGTGNEHWIYTATGKRD